MSLRKENIGNTMLNWHSVLKGVLAALVVTILGSVLLGLFYHFTVLSEKTLPVTGAILFYVSVFLGSALAARDVGSKGLLHGLVVTVLFVALNITIAKVFLQLGFSLPVLAQKGFISLLAGAIGGVIGVGLSK